MNYLDFRSDTVTHPTAKMREAMSAALLGDDMYDHDPTTKKLERLAAETLGKEAALFVPSGTFGNQLAVQIHCQPGDEVILADESHIVMHETGAAAALAGVQLRSIPAENGWMEPAAIEARIRPHRDIHYPESRLFCIENAFSDGSVLSLQQMQQMSSAARRHGLKVHLDGARIFNAATALNCQAKDIAAHADTAMFCLSKGLCAPVGSILVGSRQDMDKAKYLRKRMGGALRQTGVLAAAGIIAIEEMSQRLAEDHQRARYFADLLEQEIPGAMVQRKQLDINMVYAKVPGMSSDIIEKLTAEDIYIGHGYGEKDENFRFVTHYWTPEDAIDKLISRMRFLLGV